MRGDVLLGGTHFLPRDTDDASFDFLTASSDHDHLNSPLSALEVDPLSEEAVSISKGIPTDKCRTTDEYCSIPSRVASGATDPVPRHMPAHPAHALPAFVNELLDIPDIAAFISNLFHEQTPRIRTWYLHHIEYPRWVVPRFIELDPELNHWQHDITSTWRDMIVQEQPLRFSVVRPDPSRHYVPRFIVADLIVSQGIDQGFFAGLLTVNQRAITQHPGHYAVAISLPGFVSGNAVVSAADLRDLCQNSECNIYFRWEQLPLDNQPTHLMHEGHSFVARIHSIPPYVSERPSIDTSDAANVPLHGALQDDDPLSDPVGTAVSISLNETDQTSIMQAKPPIYKARNEIDGPDWYPPPEQGGGPQATEAAIDAADMAHDDGNSPSRDDDSDHPSQDSQSTEEDRDRQSAMMYHLNDPAVHAMIFWTDYERLMREIAWHFHIPRVELLDSYELNARP
eukprot:s2000_g18.t1